jgi:hypothetical protein
VYLCTVEHLTTGTWLPLSISAGQYSLMCRIRYYTVVFLTSCPLLLLPTLHNYAQNLLHCAAVLHGNEMKTHTQQHMREHSLCTYEGSCILTLGTRIYLYMQYSSIGTFHIEIVDLSLIGFLPMYP